MLAHFEFTQVVASSPVQEAYLFPSGSSSLGKTFSPIYYYDQVFQSLV